MANIIFFYDNEWDGVSDVVSNTEHSNFPAENTQLRDFNEPWRSLYGAESGWGKFAITASGNDRIDFDEGGGELTANLTPGTYTVDTLVAHLKTIMDAAGAHTYTWSYVESGADANKFKCVDGTGTFQFLLLAGTNVARSVGSTIGADMTLAADPAPPAATWTADFIRIHTSEALKVDLGAATDILAFMTKGHNIQSGASWNNIQGHASDSWGSPSLSEALTYGTDIMGKIFSSAESYRWWRYYFRDWDNADGYIEDGRVFLGPGFQPGRNFLNRSRTTKRVDQSIIKRAEGGQISTIQLEDYETWQYKFIVDSAADIASFETMFDAVKKSNPLWICEDPDNFPAKTYYCQFVDWQWAPLEESADYWGLTIQVEELV